MNTLPGRQRGGLYALIAAAVLVSLLLCYSLYLIVNNTVRDDVIGQTTAAASTTALAISQAIREDTRLASAVVGVDGTAALVQQTASRTTTNAVEYANLNIQQANPQITAFYFYDRSGNFVISQVANPSHTKPTRLSVSCNSTNTYCIDANPPTGYLATTLFHRQLIGGLRPPFKSTVRLAFGRSFGPFGNLYILQPILSANGTAAVGGLIEQVDASTILAPYLQDQQRGNLVLSGDVVIGHQMPAFHAMGQLPITGTGPALDAAMVGGLEQTLIGSIPGGANPEFTYDNISVLGSRAAVDAGNLVVVSYANANVLSTASTRLIVAATPFVLLLILCVAGPFLVQSRQARRQVQRAANVQRARSDSLARDIAAVSRALEVAREGSGTVRVSNRNAEVGRLSLSLNGLLENYGQVAATIARSAQSLRKGAARTQEGLQILASGLQEGPTLQGTLAFDQLGSSAAALQLDAAALADRAAQLQEEARAATQAARGNGDALRSIVDSAQDTAREFTRLASSAQRLDVLVASSQALAEHLNQQVATLTREALPIGASSGAGNLGRLSRQAHDTQDDAEAAQRSLAASLTEVQRRLARLMTDVQRTSEALPLVTSMEALAEAGADLQRSAELVARHTTAQALSAEGAVGKMGEMARLLDRARASIAAPLAEMNAMQETIKAVQASAAALTMDEMQS